MSRGKILTGLIGLVVAAGLVFSCSNRVLITRHYTQSTPNQVKGYTWYQPTEEIPGAHDGFFDVVPATQRTLSSEAIAAASTYAASNSSESLLIWHRGALQHAEYWLGHEPEDVVNSRSMHKMAGGLLIARAIADGYIDSIDDSVATYIPVWQGTDKAAITIRNVLQMSSGLRWFSIRDTPPFGLSSRRYLDPEWDKVLLHEIPMSFEPGTEYDYSDTTADVMPHIIQGATGKRYAEYFSDALIQTAQRPRRFYLDQSRRRHTPWRLLSYAAAGNLAALRLAAVERRRMERRATAAGNMAGRDADAVRKTRNTSA